MDWKPSRIQIICGIVCGLMNAAHIAWAESSSPDEASKQSLPDKKAAEEGLKEKLLKVNRLSKEVLDLTEDIQRKQAEAKALDTQIREEAKAIEEKLADLNNRSIEILKLQGRSALNPKLPAALQSPNYSPLTGDKLNYPLFLSPSEQSRISKLLKRAVKDRQANEKATEEFLIKISTEISENAKRLEDTYQGSQVQRFVQKGLPVKRPPEELPETHKIFIHP